MGYAAIITSPVLLWFFSNPDRRVPTWVHAVVTLSVLAHLVGIGILGLALGLTMKERSKVAMLIWTTQVVCWLSASSLLVMAAVWV